MLTTETNAISNQTKAILWTGGAIGSAAVAFLAWKQAQKKLKIIKENPHLSNFSKMKLRESAMNYKIASGVFTCASLFSGGMAAWNAFGEENKEEEDDRKSKYREWTEIVPGTLWMKLGPKEYPKNTAIFTKGGQYFEQMLHVRIMNKKNKLEDMKPVEVNKFEDETSREINKRKSKIQKIITENLQKNQLDEEADKEAAEAIRPLFDNSDLDYNKGLHKYIKQFVPKNKTTIADYREEELKSLRDNFVVNEDDPSQVRHREAALRANHNYFDVLEKRETTLEEKILFKYGKEFLK
jgi:hypothetical protein